MTDQGTPDPNIVRFFGRRAALGGPAALLGLELSSNLTAKAIDDALARRERMLDEHPRGKTPAADQTRMALHAAAATIRTSVPRPPQRQASAPAPAPATMPTSRPPAAPAPRPRAVRHAPTAAPPPRLVHVAKWALATDGGWTRRSSRRLTRAAAALGASHEQLLEALRQLSHPGSPPPSSVNSRPHTLPTSHTAQTPRNLPASMPPSATATEAKPGAVFASIAVIITLLLTIGGVLFVISIATSTTPVTTAAPEVVEPVPTVTNDEPPEPVPQETVATSTPPPAPDPLAALRSAIDAVGLDDAAAITSASDAMRRFAATWHDSPNQKTRAFNNEVVRLLYAAAARPQTARAITTALTDIAAEPKITTRVWAAGMIIRIGAEGELPASVHQQLARGRAIAFAGRATPTGQSFAEGALLALDVGLADLARDAEDWSAWASAVVAVGKDGSATQRVLLRGLDVLAGYEPPAPDDAIAGVARRLSFNEGSPARLWLVGRLQDSRTPVRPLHLVTSAMLIDRLASGLDASLVVQPSATETDRRNLAERYRVIWDLADTGAASLDLAWRERVLALVNEPLTRDTTPYQLLDAAVRYGSAAAATSLTWLGDIDAAGAFDRRARATPLGPVPIAPPETAAPAFPREGAWAERFLAADSDIASSLALINELDASDIRDATDAETILLAAMTSRVRQIRSAATAVIASRQGSAVLLDALLEHLERAPKTRQISAIVSALTGRPAVSVREPDWRALTRADVASALLDALAPASGGAALDRLARELADSCVARAGVRPTTGAAVPDPEAAAVELRVSLRNKLDSMSLAPAGLFRVASIETQAERRAGIASGPIQRFAVQHRAALELFAVLVSEERPDSTSQINSIIDEHNEVFDTASGAFEQIATTERAWLRLWLVRASGEAS
ncbi:MAG: hypothetical protein AAF747_05800 [Planctomycetota bacterium]